MGRSIIVCYLHFVCAIGLKLMKVKQISVIKWICYTCAIVILGSLICGFFFIDSYQDSFIYLGGQHGYYTTLLLKANIGWSGTLLVIIAGVLTFLISISSSTVPFLRKVFSLDIKASSKRKEEISSSDKNYVDEMSPNDNKNKILKIYCRIMIKKKTHMNILHPK